MPGCGGCLTALGPVTAPLWARSLPQPPDITAVSSMWLWPPPCPAHAGHCRFTPPHPTPHRFQCNEPTQDVLGNIVSIIFSPETDLEVAARVYSL
uniref:Macaca fascicularis brain cDNA, clone: QbsB-10857 n=1 Tax=Macaca fascicularis TaxID=9541 RepID=I7GM72_MACFA|nr:unnamed protein product [Macaca fascicularis]